MPAKSQIAAQAADGIGEPGSDDRESFSLEELVANRRWTYTADPFPHFHASQVFRTDFYVRLEQAFIDWLRPSDPQRAPRFGRNMPGYDALGHNFDRHLTGPFRLFFSRAWHDMIADLVGVNASRCVSGGLHHHPVGSASGGVHNDLNPGWFADLPNDEGIVIASPDTCSYTNGTPTRPGIETHELIRAVAVLFYLANPPWSFGDGGATGLYRRRDDEIGRPARIIPPHSNSLVVFECTPYSFHTFLTNRRSERNCLVMWIHRPKDDVLARWGDAPIVPW